MTARCLEIPQIKEEPFYTMTEAARLVGTSTQTLIVYRKRELIFPVRNGRGRLFSTNDIRWLRCIRELIHDDKISIEALKKLLEYAHCWEIKKCSGEQPSCMKLKEAPLSRSRPGALPAAGGSRGPSTANSCWHTGSELSEGS
jgi:DNA-binding transcriptional MerR regulator